MTTELEFRQRLTKGFANARRRGYFARQNWQCCQGCGCAALPEGTTNYVFYHAQDAAGIHESYRLRHYTPMVYLAWSGDGEELRRCFLEARLAVVWDGAADKRIRVTMPPAEPPVEAPTAPDVEYLECLRVLLAC